VAQPLQREPRQAGSAHPADEGGAHGIGLQAGAVGVVEHQASVVEAWSDEHPLLEHLAPVLAEHSDRPAVERDRPAATGRLRLADRDLAPHLDDRLHDVQPVGVEVDVRPPEAECLASPHARRRQQHPQRVLPVARVGRGGQESTQRRRVPGVDAVRLRAASGRVGSVGGITGEPAPPHGVLQGPVEDGVHVVDRPRVEARPDLLTVLRIGVATEEAGERVLRDVVGLAHLGSQASRCRFERQPIGSQLERTLDDL
jgi:hypothetical protein